MSGSTPPPPPPPPPPPMGPPPPPMGPPPMGPGMGQPYGASGNPPQDWLVVAIVGTVVGLCTSCFGLITGIVAIVYANKSKKLWAAGDGAGAYQAANNAKIWVIVTFALIVLGVIFGIINVATGSFRFGT